MLTDQLSLKAVAPDRTEVKAGTKVYDFRGDRWTFCYASQANGLGRDGKVVVYDDIGKREFYARVFELTVERR
jgi:hypothetical protein